MVGGFPAAEVVVVHRRQVVVNQGVGVDQFQRTGDRHQSRRLLPHRFRRGNGQDRTDSLPSRHETVPHAFVERGGWGGSRWCHLVQETIDFDPLFFEIIFDVHEISVMLGKRRQSARSVTKGLEAVKQSGAREWPRLSFTARIGRAHSDRARSASKNGAWPLPSSSLFSRR